MRFNILGFKFGTNEPGGPPPDPAAGPEPVQSLWIGDRLSTLERLSIASFLKQGHPFHLYAYDDVQNAPAGTTFKDANAILPRSDIFTYQSGPGKGSYAAFADLFRYKLLLDAGGWWVDTDVVCLRPFDFGRAYVFGRENEGWINCAVLRAPAGSKMIRRAYKKASRSSGEIKWGAIGPELLSKVVKKYCPGIPVEPSSTFYPIRWDEFLTLTEPGGRVPRESHAVHLWNEMWRREGLDKDARHDETCIFEQLKAELL